MLLLYLFDHVNDQVLDHHWVRLAVRHLHHRSNQRHDRASLAGGDNLLDDLFVFFNNLRNDILEFFTGLRTSCEALALSNLGRHPGVAVNNQLHNLLAVGQRDSAHFIKVDQINEALMAEVVHDDMLKVFVFLDTVAEDVLVNPTVYKNLLTIETRSLGQLGGTRQFW